MKVSLSLKSPDGVSESINEAALSLLPEGYDADADVELLFAEAKASLREKFTRWIVYDEYVTIEIDTEANTAIVCEQNQQRASRPHSSSTR